MVHNNYYAYAVKVDNINGGLTNPDLNSIDNQILIKSHRKPILLLSVMVSWVIDHPAWRRCIQMQP